MLSFSQIAVADCKKSKTKPADENVQMQGMDMSEDTAHGCMMGMTAMKMEGHSVTSNADPSESAGPRSVVDPVCGMSVDPETAEKSIHQGKPHYFCSKEDRDLFEKSPEMYLKGKGPAVN